jgi:hypothetical protein
MALGLKEGAISFAWNEHIMDKMPAEIRQAGEQALSDIASGNKSIPKYSLGED